MKNKIAVKLAAYFAVVLVAFAICVGGIFAILMRSNTIRLNNMEMERKAGTIARTLARFAALNDGELPSGGDGEAALNEYENYLQYLNDIAQGAVWVVNEDLDIIAQTNSRDKGQRQEDGAKAPEIDDGEGEGQPPKGQSSVSDYGLFKQKKSDRAETSAGTDGNEGTEKGGTEKMRFRFGDLPPQAEQVVKEVFDGQTSISESFSGVMGMEVLTVGMPILYDGEVIGVVLLHSPATGIRESQRSGLYILLISLAIALAFGAALSIVFSYSFTKPLNRMKDTALQLAHKNYRAVTNVFQKDEIGELAQTLDMLAGRLDEADKASEKLEQVRREYVANISHELRTPVTVMRGLLEALSDGMVSDGAQVREVHAQLLDETICLQRLVNDLLDLSRLQNVDFAIEKFPVNLCDVVSDTRRSAMRLAQAKDVELTVRIPETPCVIDGDYGRLRQMIMVVIDNAIKFSPQGSKVNVDMRRSGKRVEIIVRDEGMGIPEKDLPYIFDRFYKTKGPDNKNGTGLGLAIAKQIALRHGASILARNAQGGGCCFTFEFTGVREG